MLVGSLPPTTKGDDVAHKYAHFAGVINLVLCPSKVRFNP